MSDFKNELEQEVVFINDIIHSNATKNNAKNSAKNTTKNSAKDSADNVDSCR